MHPPPTSDTEPLSLPLKSPRSQYPTGSCTFLVRLGRSAPASTRRVALEHGSTRRWALCARLALAWPCKGSRRTAQVHQQREQAQLVAWATCASLQKRECLHPHADFVFKLLSEIKGRCLKSQNFYVLTHMWGKEPPNTVFEV